MWSMGSPVRFVESRAACRRVVSFVGHNNLAGGVVTLKCLKRGYLER